MAFLGFLYGVVAYLVFLASFLYAIGFVGNVIVPKSIDAGSAGSSDQAFIINIVLLGVWAIAHSIMARQGFKRVWTKVIPEPVERSTYVLVSSLLLCLIFWKWEPMTAIVWSTDNAILTNALLVIFGIGWAVVLVSTFLINHFDLFGLRQVWLLLQGKEYTPVPFVKVSMYKYVRHPLLLGFLIAFWATPVMTRGHLLFSVATTAYMFIGIMLEEKDLLNAHGESYANYRREVSMILPFPPKK